MNQQQGQMPAGPDQATQLFEQGLSEQAYQLLSSKMPDLVPKVVTFKILSTDVDRGYAVGAFILEHAGMAVYAPVVMSSNAVKPLDVMYVKDKNMFFPLTKGWLDELEKHADASLGGGVKTPETLYTDVDIRNVTVPPLTGRFSYAADATKLTELLSVENLEKVGHDITAMLPRLLEQAPNRVKSAFRDSLSRDPQLLKEAAAIYGLTTLAQVLQPKLEKISAKQNFGGALWIADKDNTPTDFKRIFGDKAGEAYAGVRKRGFAAKDERLERNMAVKEQPYERWIEPNQADIYTLYATDGRERPALVVPNPVDVFDSGTRYGRRPAIRGHAPIVDNSYYDPETHGSSNKYYPYGRPDEGEFVAKRGWDAPKYLAVFPDGDYIQPMVLVGRDLVAESMASGALHERMFKDVSGAPKAGKGFFVRQIRSGYQATVPMEITSISTDADGVRRIKVKSPGGFEERTITTDERNPYNTIWMPKGSQIVYIPAEFIWVPLKERQNERDWIQSIHHLADCSLSMLASAGAKKVNIKDAGARQFSVNGSGAMDKIAALKKLAHEYVLDCEDAWTLLEKAASDGTSYAWVASPRQLAQIQMRLDKVAADDDKKSGGDKPKKKSPPSGGSKPPTAGAAPGGDAGGGDDALGQQAAMAAMAQPPPPPEPSPVELAAMEMDQAIQHEMQKLMERQQTVQAIVQRSHEIAGGSPMMPTVQTQSMGAPPSSMNLATGGPGMIGSSPMGPGGPGGMGGMQGMPGMSGGQPGMGMDPSMQGMQDPSMMGGQDPSMMGGQDPSMQGGMPQMGMGMDPSMQGMHDPSMTGMDPSMQGMQDPSMMGMQGMQDPSMMGMDPSMQQGQQPPPGAMMPTDGPSSHDMMSEINPQFLHDAARLQSEDVFDAAAVAMLAQSPALHNVVSEYLPNLEKSVDNLARVMLTLWMQEVDLRERVGEATFEELEQSLQTTFRGMGELVLRLARGAQGTKEPESGESVS
jgi:hypothetical protein